MTILTTATDALAFFGLISSLPFAPLSDQDYMAFADAGPNARITFLDSNKRREAEQMGQLCELLDLRAVHESGLAIIIGGDALQLEIHGIDSEGDPIALTLGLGMQEGF